MSDKIKVLAKRPGYPAYMTWISNNLPNLQKFVGGYIETVRLTSDVIIICNEEGKLKGLEHCCNICGEEFVGNIILCGVDGEDFADIPCGLDTLRYVIPSLWEVEVDEEDDILL